MPESSDKENEKIKLGLEEKWFWSIAFPAQNRGGWNPGAGEGLMNEAKITFWRFQVV